MVKLLIVLALIANAIGMFFPSLESTFTPYYGSIAKHIVLTNDWTDLVLSGHDWMDKPHLPFWLTALSYKVFGINSFAYILPGFLFNLLGVFYTYRLARFWYSKEVGVLCALFTITALHIMLSSIDVRAEAFLIGEIIPACYYWLKYDHQTKFKYLILGAFFTGLALMTKGLFVLITIISGVAALWIYRKEWKNFISIKWIFALLLSFVFAVPELIALYQQFDLHPDKIVFNRTHMSGIKWFFWDSQFGRFFSTGEIVSTYDGHNHWLFFIHTFLWAYLPWWPMFVAAIITAIKKRKLLVTEAGVFFYASFFVTFLVFSASSFQVDHYTNILFPFASIICAKWLVDKISVNNRAPIIFWIELFISIILLGVVFIISPLILTGVSLIIVLVIASSSLITFLVLWKRSWFVKIVVYPSIAISTVFIFVMFVNGIEYAKYDAGYQIACYLNQQTAVTIPVVGYKVGLYNLELKIKHPYQIIDKPTRLTTIHHSFYLVTKYDSVKEVEKYFPNSTILANISGVSINTYLQNAINSNKLTKQLTKYIIIKVNS